VLTVQPVGSVLLGIVLLGEDPAPLQLAGVAVVVAGILVATRRGVAQRPSHERKMLDTPLICL
jgi:drug/metabolite transporter (DMT)-like permease